MTRIAASGTQLTAADFRQLLHPQAVYSLADVVKRETLVKKSLLLFWVVLFATSHASAQTRDGSSRDTGAALPMFAAPDGLMLEAANDDMRLPPLANARIVASDEGIDPQGNPTGTQSTQPPHRRHTLRNLLIIYGVLTATVLILVVVADR